MVNAEKKNLIAVLRKNSVFYQEVKTAILCNWTFSRFYNRKNQKKSIHRIIGEKNECPKGNNSGNVQCSLQKNLENNKSLSRVDNVIRNFH